MKIRWMLIISLLLLLAHSWTGWSSAQTNITLNPTHDATVQSANPTVTNNTISLGVQGQNSSGTCNSTIETYLKFDLSGVTGTIQSASLSLRSNFASSSGNLTMGLFGSTNDSWDEATVTWNTKPALDMGTSLGSASLTAAGSNVSFANTTNLLNFLNTQRSGDGTATLGIVATACDAASVAQAMDSTEGSTSPQLPLPATLATFSAISQPDYVLVDWATVAEQDNLGFNVLRSTSAEGEQVTLNADLIPSQAPGSGQGASYSFEDGDVEDGTTYYYWLQDVDTSGITTLHGPVSVLYESSPTAVDVGTLAALEDGSLPWASAALGSVLCLAAAGYVWYRRGRLNTYVS